MKKIRLFLAVICVAFCLATTFYVAQSTPVLAASSTSSTKKVDVSKLKIKLSATTYNYNGKEKKPSVSVSYKGKKVSRDYYSVKYSSGRKFPGSYKVTVSFKGKYAGKKTLTYKIVLQSPSVKSSSESKSIGLSWSKTTKASRYIIYNNSKKQIAKVKGTSYTIKKLKPGTKYIFYIRSYAKIGDKSYYSPYVKVETATKPVISGTTSLYVGGSKTFTAAVGSKVKVTWSSSDKKIAIVSSSGKVTAVKAGKVKIKAKANGITASYTLTVKTPTIKLDASTLEIYTNGVMSLNATVTPSSMKVKWISSDMDVAEVDSNGDVYAISEGVATITAVGTYGGKTYKKSCKVSVISYEKSGYDTLVNYMEEYGYENQYGEKFVITSDVAGNNEYTYVIYYDPYEDSFEFSALSSCNSDNGIGESLSFIIDRSSSIVEVEGIIIHYMDGYVNGSGGAIGYLDLDSYTSDTELEFEWQPGTTAYIKNSEEDAFNSFLQLAFIKWEQLMYHGCGIRLTDLGFMVY